MPVDTRPPPPAWTAPDLPDPRAERPATGHGSAGSVAGWLAIGTAGVGVALLSARAAGFDPGPCLARRHLGGPCPACGLTHLADHLMHGRLGAAVGADLPGSLLLAVLAVAAVVQLVAWRRGRPVAWLHRRALPVALGSLLAAHWALTAVTGGATA